MSRALCLLAIAGLAAMTGACQSGEKTPTYTVRDSAGVSIVENHSPVWGEGDAWHVADAPRLSIGSQDATAAYSFFDARRAHRLPDGRIAVAHASTQEVRLFAPDGNHIRSLGRRGQGPGEFIGLSRVWSMPGDSLLVADAGSGLRLSIFSPAGAFVRSVRPQTVRGAELEGAFADGSMLVLRHDRGEPEVAGGRLHVFLFRLASDGATLDSVGRFVNQTSSPEGMYMWGAWAQQAVGDTTFFHGPGDRFEIEERTRNGALIRIIRLARAPRAPTQSEIEATKDRMMNSKDARESPPLAAFLSRARFASMLPVHFHMRTDSEGNLWVQEYGLVLGEGRVWSVFDAAGVYLGDVTMPERFRVDAIGSDYVLGVWRDELDVEHVRLYAIVKPGRA